MKEMSTNSSPKEIVSNLIDTDNFCQWLGIELLEAKKGYCIIQMTIRKDMLNAFSIAHGGITYSLADSALAYASNSQGRICVSIETSISHTISLKEGDVITAVAEEMSLSNKIGIYQVTIKNQNDKIVALFKGTVYRTSKELKVTNSESVQIYETGDIAPEQTKNKVLNQEITNIEPQEFYDSIDGFSNGKEFQINKNTTLIYPELSYKIIGSAFEIFNNIGGNHKELIYQKALYETFQNNNITVQQQVFNPVKIKEKTVGKNYFDFIVENKIVVEIKSSERFSKSHFDQLLNYLIVSKLKLGILISFGRNEVKFKRVLNVNLLNQEKTNVL